ncbi:MAG: FG-GAP-like repeat-containing protein [Gemmatimonadaceae bacterium]|nr:FG-GAP-like repeat-containing protein [Gemmatimonadaceae bacterium]
MFVDVDLDGRPDLLTVNGHRWDVRDADTYERIRNAFPRVAWNREQGEFPELKTKSVAFRNRGDLTFEDASARWRFGTEASIAHGVALGDLDGDGDMDVTVTRLNAPPVVYRNESAAPRIAVRLRGARAVGAVVRVTASSLPVQRAEVSAGGAYLSGSHEQLTFATGTDSVVMIHVRWRNGLESVIPAAHPNRLYDLDERDAEIVFGSPAPPPPPPPFADVTALLGGHAHVDALLDDAARQPLLPNRLSELGPGVSWVDADGDGRDDLIVAGGRGGALTLLHNGATGFTATRAALTNGDQTTVLPAPDGRGGVRLLVGHANYAAPDTAAAVAAPRVYGFPLTARGVGAAAPVVPGERATVGPLAMGDVNSDGIVDLFLGARVIPGAWPLPAPSRLLLGRADGSFVPDAGNAAAMAGLGLVSGATFTDLDGDGWLDLVAVGEFGPIRLLHNERGRLVDAARRFGLDTLTSRWNGVTAGDFDGDGRLDIVVTSWGRNLPWQVSRARPYVAVIGQWGIRGPGLLFAQRDSADREMPLESFARLGTVWPNVRERIASYADYAKADVDAVLGPMSASAVRIGATTFDHVVLLNRGDRFEVRALPVRAQLAPAFGVVVADFDGNGTEDLFLAQNVSGTEIGTPRFDAGAGQLLLGDGTGEFTALRVPESGIAMLGDGRGAAAADYDGDGRVDLAVAQHAAATRLWRNVRAVPGVRVRVRGSAGNPFGAGVQLRVVGPRRRGPVRELRVGGGYWSTDASTVVLARPADATGVWVRWPSGRAETVPLPRTGNVLELRAP